MRRGHVQILQTWNALMERLRELDFLAPLAVRLYLVPVFFAAGRNKLTGFENTVEWFGNPDWGLGLPAPFLMALMATATELVGALCLLLGVGVRVVALPLMFVMLVAAVTVHGENGWFAIADPAMCLFHCDGLEEAAIALDPLFEQALIVGEGEAYLSALVVLNGEEWVTLAKELNLDPFDKQNLNNKKVQQHLLKHIKECLKDFPGYAKIRRVTAILDPWTVENDLMTPTLKIKRAKGTMFDFSPFFGLGIFALLGGVA